MKFRIKNGSLLFEDLSQESHDLYPNQVVQSLDSEVASPDPILIAAHSELEPHQVIETVCARSINHLVQKNEGRFEQDLISTARLIADPKAYFQSDYQFFPKPDSLTITIPFESSHDKTKLKEKTFDFTHNLGGSSLVSAADAVIEELYMNAVIDAPREAKLKGQQGKRAPSEFFLCRSQEWLQISCADFYGSLDIQKFLGRMREVYKNGAGEMINLEKPGGAGLGCVILFENSASLVLGVQPGVQTKVTCLIPLSKTNRQRTEMKKSLHWFEI